MTAMTTSDGRPIEGGAARPVYVPDSESEFSGDPAIPVYVLEGDEGIPVMGGPALSVVEAPAGYPVQGGPAIPVRVVTPSADQPLAGAKTIYARTVGGDLTALSGLWYLAGSAPLPVAVYEPYGAADLASSYINVVNPGVFDAAPGVAPTFSPTQGWIFNGSSQYLTTGLSPAEGWSIVIQYMQRSTGNTGVEFGSLNGSNRFWMWGANTAVSRDYGHGGDLQVSGRIIGGIPVVAGNKAYINGQADGDIAAGSYTFLEPYIGCLNNGGSPAFYFSGYVMRIAIYDQPLTQAQVAAIYSNMGPSLATFGDSVTAGTGATDFDHRWVSIVAESAGLTLNNAGLVNTVLQNTVQNTVSTIGGAVDSNGRDNYVARVVNVKPTYVCIMYGLNDLRLDDAAFTAANFENDLGEVVDGLLADGILAENIVIGSPPYIPEASYTYAPFAPWDAGSRVKHAAYTAACAAVAAAKGTKYIDVYQWMTDNGGDSLISVDTVHPNDSGHAAIAAAFLSVL